MNSFISPISQAKLKTLIKLKLKKYRYYTKTYLCEGYRLFTAALASNSQGIREVILSDSFIKNSYYSNVLDICNQNKIPIYDCTDRTFKSLSDEKSPSGLIFVMSLSFFQNSDVFDISENIIIYIENIADPGNLGAIIRSASWFGIEHILLSPGSVDPFNPKVVRATAGGIFNLNLYLDIELETVTEFGINNKSDFIGTIVQDGTSLSNWKVSDKNIIFFGNEANGLTKSALQILTKKITITGAAKLESLNLAVTAGIILNHLYQAKKN
jgi:TrmH family RNA methyltransferase